MPTYLYECDTHGEFEEYHSITTKLEDCPQCQKENLPSKNLKRLISGGSGRGIVELTGHELTAKTKEDVRKMKHRAATDVNYHANIVGESKFNKMVGGK
jgi:putative FmdB family regulatory protein